MSDAALAWVIILGSLLACAALVGAIFYVMAPVNDGDWDGFMISHGQPPIGDHYNGYRRKIYNAVRDRAVRKARLNIARRGGQA